MALPVDDRLGQPELRDAVDEHAAGGVQRLEDHDSVALLGQVGGAGQTGGASAHDGDVLARLRGPGRRDHLGDGRLVVGGEALEPADGDGVALLVQDAHLLALGLLRADAAADGGQIVGELDLLGGGEEAALAKLQDEAGDVDVDRAAGDAGRGLALQAAIGLGHGHLGGVAQGDLLEVVPAHARVLGGHRHPHPGLGAGLSELAAFFLVALAGQPLLAVVGRQAREQNVEVNLVGVELGAVDAGELHLALDVDPAAAAHPGAVDHDRVEADDGLDVVRHRHLGDGAHHHRRADRDDAVDALLAVDEALQHAGDEAALAVRAVVGRHEQRVRVLAHLLFPEDEVFRARAHDADDVVAGLLQRALDREDRRDAQAAADADDVAEVGNLGLVAQRAHHVEQPLAFLELVELLGGNPDDLHDQRDPALGRRVVRDGQRNALALLVAADDDELPGRAESRDRRAVYPVQADRRTQGRLLEDQVLPGIRRIQDAESGFGGAFADAALVKQIAHLWSPWC